MAEAILREVVDLEARCQERLIGQVQVIHELEVLVGDENLAAARIDAVSDRCDF